MSNSAPVAAPVLSTPDSHVFEHASVSPVVDGIVRLDDEQLYVTYEIVRTVEEIRAGKWKRVALQFPDSMLSDAPRVYQQLSRGLSNARKSRGSSTKKNSAPADDQGAPASEKTPPSQAPNPKLSAEDIEEQLFILADTSYGACCVDEVAAEHADADVVVHYGRSCLSPTARLPVIYCFTKPFLDTKNVVEVLQSTYSSRDQKIILMADIPYCSYLDDILKDLDGRGYTSVHVASVKSDFASPLPNRTVPLSVEADNASLSAWSIFHIAEPPASLLLTLASRVGDIHIYSTSSSGSSTTNLAGLASSTIALRRRYALLTSLSTTAIFGILVNTLSVRNYLSMVEHVRATIAAAGKKSYTFVVGKVNAAKVANFAEVGGWVVVGCWESSLFDSRDFWKPVVTPFELELALTADAERVWTGAWRSDFQAVFDEGAARRARTAAYTATVSEAEGATMEGEPGSAEKEEEDSAPPEFDLRTGRYVSNTRPMRMTQIGPTTTPTATTQGPSNALIARAKGDLATIGGQVSPAAEFFRNNRSWQGLGSDHGAGRDAGKAMELASGAQIEEGRTGIARGYTFGDNAARR